MSLFEKGIVRSFFVQSILFSIKNLIMYSVADAVDYDLFVIEEEATPLAAGLSRTSYVTSAMITMVLIIALVGFAIWLVKRNEYKKRLIELREQVGDFSGVVPFGIRAIKDEIAKCEAEITASYF